MIIAIKQKLTEWSFDREGSPFLAFNERTLSLLLNTKIHINLVSSEIYGRDDFDFDIVNFPLFFFLAGYVPRSTSCGVHISQLFRFARVTSHVTDFNFSNRAVVIICFEKHCQNVIADTMNWFLTKTHSVVVPQFYMLLCVYVLELYDHPNNSCPLPEEDQGKSTEA